jgi:hypothetical protein
VSGPQLGDLGPPPRELGPVVTVRHGSTVRRRAPPVITRGMNRPVDEVAARVAGARQAA